MEAPAAPRTARTPGPAGTQRERVPVLIFDDAERLARQVARRVATLVEQGQSVGRPVVLGLPTGSTPVGVYRELVRMHREEGLDFSNVVTFNLDEYVPMQPDSLQSYHRFMREHLFDHVNVRPENVHIPRGDLDGEELEAHAHEYERQIEAAGGLDLVLLGIGRSGHVGFNEPGSGPETETRVVALDETTRKDAASDFFGGDYVPRRAVTMGVGTILSAREVILIAVGEHKAPIVRRAVEEPPSTEVAATFLQHHRNAAFYVDRAAAANLTRERAPWLVEDVEWTDELSRRATIWLSEETGKALLTLDRADFERHGLHALTLAHGDPDKLCRAVFEGLRRRVAYAPDLPSGQRVLLLSPHPDDDVISMGGMLGALVEAGNEVTVAYMTNGSVAVFDADVRKYLRFVAMSRSVLGDGGRLPDDDAVPQDAARVADRAPEVSELLYALEEKAPGQPDGAAIQAIKAQIRYAEAVAALEVMGLGPEDARFLDLPFYRTGLVKKNPITDADVDILADLFDELRPHHLFVAGDLSDPHGTHRLCYDAAAAALRRYKKAVEKSDAPEVWLYRGAWQEWEVHRADVFLPLSRAEVGRKMEAIFKHESQKDRAMFPGGHDEREFWERARDRNTGTAQKLDRLGLPEFYAAEAYVVTDTL